MSDPENGGWELPCALRVDDLGIGTSETSEAVDVQAGFGPRYLDLQSGSGVAASWKECLLHARNVTGEDDSRELTEPYENQPGKHDPETRDQAEIFTEGPGDPPQREMDL